MKEDSIFQRYYKEKKFIDRKNSLNEESIDVICPIINTNELFEINLYSWYRQIPINRLLIGFGGGTDNSLEIVKKFPRVIIIDQSTKYGEHLYGSQGISIAELISSVETEWFIYLHSDVYLPDNWYDTMIKHQDDYDWFECGRIITTLVSYKHEIDKHKRAYSGSQMGRKKAFRNIIPIIEDGFLQNNEDIIFQELILKEGYKYGRVLDTKHYHQVMNKRGEKEPKYKRVEIERFLTQDWKEKIYNVQVRGIIKYCDPKPYLIREVNGALRALKWYKAINLHDFTKWVEKTNSSWVDYLDISEEEKKQKPPPTLIQKVYNKLRDMLNPLIKKLDSLINPRK